MVNNTKNNYIIQLGADIGGDLYAYASARSVSVTAMAKIILAEWLIKKGEHRKSGKDTVDEVTVKKEPVLKHKGVTMTVTPQENTNGYKT